MFQPRLVLAASIRISIFHADIQRQFFEIFCSLTSQETKKLHLIQEAHNSCRYSESSGVEEFKYLGTTLTNQNCIKVEVKSRLKLGNACYHSVQKL